MLSILPEAAHMVAIDQQLLNRQLNVRKINILELLWAKISSLDLEMKDIWSLNQ